jgi:hypothetical protein
MIENRKKLFNLYFKVSNELKQYYFYKFNQVKFIDDFLNVFEEEKGASGVFKYFQSINRPLYKDGTQRTYKSFIEDYCCDLQWAKDRGYCGGSTIITPSPDPNENKKIPSPPPTTTIGSGCPSTSATEDDVKNGKEFIQRCVQGDIVTKIQKHLKKHGFNNVSKTGEPDGEFGSRTEGSVEAFQREKGLKVDGIVGPKTWAELIKDKTTTPITPVVPPKTTTEPDQGLEDIIGGW